MIPKLLEQIGEDDLNNLVAGGTAERRTLDYKQQLPDPNDAWKRELLADVSSFANTTGGDLVFGMTEVGGVPTGIPGVVIGNVDQEILRIDSIIRSGLSPRIRHATHPVRLGNGNYVLVVRAEQSWYGPHRVVFKGDSRFHGRTSNGKYELDVTDLKNAFLATSTLSEKISAFRTQRIIALESGRSPIPLAPSPKLLVHCIPFASFGNSPTYDVFGVNIEPMYPRGLTGYRKRINFEGGIVTDVGTPPLAYTQVYRNGVIEAVRVGVLSTSRDPAVIPSGAYEEAILTYLRDCFRLLRELGCTPPVLIGISLIGVRGSTLSLTLNEHTAYGGAIPIDRDVLELPLVVAEAFDVNPNQLLRPVIDMVWNACGLPASLNFNQNGEWASNDRR